MDIFPSVAIRTWEMDPSGRIKKKTFICVTAAAASRMEDWDAFAWKRRKLSMHEQGKSNETIYDVRYSRISGGVRDSSEKNRPFGEKPADSAGRLHRLWAGQPALQEKYGSEKVIALMGNHEKALLDWLEEYADVNRHIGSVERYRSREWLASDADGDYETLRSFLKEEHFREFLEKEALLSADSQNAEAVRLMLEDAGELITWMCHLPYFYETERQILVHAGIAEWGEKDWLCVTSRELMVGKRTVSRGAFYKDVIAGHISTAKISGNRTYDGIWHDGQSHYYLDGTTWRSGKIPVLEYDSETGKYREIG